MGQACNHSCRNMHVFTECVSMCEHGIASALRWGVALIGDFLYWALLTPSWENHFQVLEVHRAMRLTNDLSCEETGYKWPCYVLL